MGYYDHESARPTCKENSFSISTVIPMGQGEVHLGYDRSKLKTVRGSDDDGRQIKATYQYNLSKRTAMYGTVARLANKDGTTRSLAGGSPITAAPDGRWQLEGLRARRSSLLLIGCSPRASRRSRKAAFGRPFSLPRADSRAGIPF